MAWTLERFGSPASRVTLPVMAGDVTVEQQQDTGIFRSVNGTVTVWQSPPQPGTPTIPEMHITDPTTLTRLRNMCLSGATLLLTGEDGTTYKVKAVNGFNARLLGTPDRARRPKYRVTVEFVGVR